MPACRGQRGFTYLWVLISVALMAMGTLVAVEVFQTDLRREKERELLRIGREFRTAIASYHQSSRGRSADGLGYPESLEQLLLDSRFPNVRRHLRRIYIDPMTGKAEWGLIRVNGRIVGVHSLASGPPIRVAGFEATEAEFSRATSYQGWVFVYRPE
jgi:type II secretory pathway pseudopilin PulG